MTTTWEAAKGRWGEIYSHFGLEITGKKHAKECPLCGGKNKFRITDRSENGDWVCTCGAGHGLKLLMEWKGWDFAAAAKEVNSIIGHTLDKENITPKKVDTRKTDAVRLYKSGVPVDWNNPGGQYLQGRGLKTMPRGGVKYVQHLGLVAIASDPFSQPVYKHETYLDGIVKVSRKQHSLTDSAPDSSISIKLFPVASVLGIAEGIESALAVHELERCNVWSVLNTGFMSKFIAPPGVDHLMIWLDNDANAAGWAAAFTCANKNIVARRKNDIKQVTVISSSAGDALDHLNNGGKIDRFEFYRKDRK